MPISSYFPVLISSLADSFDLMYQIGYLKKQTNTTNITVKMERCALLLLNELVFKVQEVVLIVPELKVLYKVVAAYGLLPLSLPYIDLASQPLYKIPFIHSPGSNTAGAST